MTDIRIHIGEGERESFIAGQFANRHGLVAGATGTGKSVTLETLALGFSAAGVPVFLADVKGDISGLATGPAPVAFLDVYGVHGRRLHVSVSRLGPELLARVLGLSDVQAGVLDVVFQWATQSSAPLSTLRDLRAVLSSVAANARDISAQFGLVGQASIAAIQRALIRVERDGGAAFFAAPSFDVADLMQVRAGRGLVTILAAEKLMQSPQLYATTLLFMLGELFERLPEVGDLDRPRLVLFFDEAHLLFADCPPALLRRIEQTVRLIRSKGVGVYFATQSPADIPPAVLGQLGNRIQHALRAATLQDQRAIRAAAETLPLNPRIDAARAIGEMGVGRALVSTIGPNGAPQPVDLVRVALPACRLGPLTDQERAVFKPAPEARREANPYPLATFAWVVVILGVLALAGYWLLASGKWAPALVVVAALFFVKSRARRRGR